MKRQFTLLLILTLLLTVVGGNLAQEPNVLRVATTRAVTTWNPATSFSTEANYMANIYETLVVVNAPDAEEEFSPALATSWETSEDGLTWTFTLREGVTFHDGAALTSDAVVRSVNLAREIGGAGFIWFPLDTVEAVDDLTVQFNLTYPAPLPLILGSTYGAWIVSPNALDAYAADNSYFDAGVASGTGPYMLTEYTPDAEIILMANEDYWGGWNDNQFDILQFSIVADAVTQEQLLLGGEADFADRLPPSSYDAFVENGDFEVFTEVTLFNYIGYMNVLRPPLDNATFRQALSYATPYEQIIEVAAEGLATQARGAVPQGVFPYSEDVPQYTYDVEQAQALLAESGVDPSTISLRLTYAAENAVEETMAPLLKDAWEQALGIEVTIEGILFSQQWDEAKSDPENAQDVFLVLYWPTYSDAGADNLWSLFRSSAAPFFNLSYWANLEFDALIDEAGILSGTDLDGARDLYTEAQTLLVEEAPGLFFMDVGAWYAVPTYITGFEYNLNYPFSFNFYNLEIAS